VNVFLRGNERRLVLCTPCLNRMCARVSRREEDDDDGALMKSTPSAFLFLSPARFVFFFISSANDFRVGKKFLSCRFPGPPRGR